MNGTREHCLLKLCRLVRQNPENLTAAITSGRVTDVDPIYQYLCLIAVTHSPDALQHIDLKFTTDISAIMTKLVTSHEIGILEVPTKYRNSTLYKAAVTAFPIVLSVVPPEHQTLTMCYDVLRLDRHMKRFIRVDLREFVEFKPMQESESEQESDSEDVSEQDSDQDCYQDPDEDCYHDSDEDCYQNPDEDCYQDADNNEKMDHFVEPTVCTADELIQSIKTRCTDHLLNYDMFDLNEPATVALCEYRRWCIDDKHKSVITHIIDKANSLKQLIKTAYTQGFNFGIGDMLIKKGVKLDKPIDDSGMHPIHHVCKTDSTVSLYELLKYGVSINCPDANGSFPIHYAKSHHCIGILLSHTETDMNAQDNNGDTLLHLCCKNIHITNRDAILKNLIESDRVNLYVTNSEGKMPLQLLCENENILLPIRCNIIKQFLMKTNDLYNAINFVLDSYPVAKQLLEFVQQQQLGFENIWLHTLLFSDEAKKRLTKQQRHDLVPLFVQAGCSLNKLTVLHNACLEGDLDMVRILVSLGANRSEKDEAGKQPIVYAVQNEFWDIVDLLMN